MGKFVTREIPAFALRPNDVIVEKQDGRRDKTTIVKWVTRHSKHAIPGSKTHHTGCYGIHVNGSACWDADARLRVTRETRDEGTEMEFLAQEFGALMNA